ncbi:Unsaturated rhamnogalacturonyl hydrolase yteR [Fusarium oxysporum f. sp. cubense race 1]|uniref:Unsaturated rhamnogalacturonyl hydrolase yteR n=1 Tax=Fusarium oxysporum f. sp. cubense (strain race 1) TaxID=1229664 RepID=N4TY53_FUSC1|nr:Unsaturated rhamnogalacturonyl hydrolase yteR [Fusarium oxysporum f. sp. cubense race 1]
MADTMIAKGVKPDLGYQDAVLYLGFEKAYELSGDQKYLDWYIGQIDGPVVQEDGSIKGLNTSRYILDEYRMGHNYLYLYNQTGEPKYETAANTVRRMLDSYPRTPSGGFWHQQFFRDQMWLDGIFMADSFYARWTHLYDSDNDTAWDDILLQYELIHENTINETTGLHVHGWVEGEASWADPETGRAPNVWGRALGWYFMALVEVLQYFPTSHSGYDQLLRYLESVAKGLKASRDPDLGSWWQVMNEPYPKREGNFIESSGSSMFTWGLLKAVDLGYLDSDEYLETAKDAFTSSIDNFVTEGEDGSLILNSTVAECGLTSSNVTFEYYVSRPKLENGQNGVGPFMLASYEWESWAKDA